MSVARPGLHLQPNREVHLFNAHCLYHFAQAVIFVAIGIVLAKWVTGISEWREVIAAENGPVERISAAVWLMGYIWCIASAYSQRDLAVEWLSIAIFLLLFGLRELDAHVWATGWNLDKIANYWNPQFSLQERVLVFGVLIFSCLIVGWILRFRLWKVVGRAWSKGEAWFNHLLLGLGLLVLCLILDKVGPYNLLFFEISDSGKIFLMMIEEFLELVLSVFALVSLWPYFQQALLYPE